MFVSTRTSFTCRIRGPSCRWNAIFTSARYSFRTCPSGLRRERCVSPRISKNCYFRLVRNSHHTKEHLYQEFWRIKLATQRPWLRRDSFSWLYNQLLLQQQSQAVDTLLDSVESTALWQNVGRGHKPRKVLPLKKKLRAVGVHAERHDARPGSKPRTRCTGTLISTKIALF
jgi:hypothetical protein